jgi:hypothetical protein
MRPLLMIENGISKCIMQEIEKEFIMRDKQNEGTAVPRSREINIKSGLQGQRSNKTVIET